MATCVVGTVITRGPRSQRAVLLPIWALLALFVSFVSSILIALARSANGRCRRRKVLKAVSSVVRVTVDLIASVLVGSVTPTFLPTRTTSTYSNMSTPETRTP